MAELSQPGSRLDGGGLSREWRGETGVALMLSHYSGRGRQERHEHDHMQVSFLLAGSMEETIGRVRHELNAPAMCIKPAGTDHSDLWGERGALLLSIRIGHWDGEAPPPASIAAWRRPRSSHIGPIVGAALAARDPAEIDEIVDDLLALLPGDAPPAGPPPRWLRDAREAIDACDTLTAEQAARIAGVHRVHLSRSFASCFGVPMSVYRRRLRSAKALEALFRSRRPLADVAQLAGFADQSHMHRALREIAGATPRRLRQTLRDANDAHSGGTIG